MLVVVGHQSTVSTRTGNNKHIRILARLHSRIPCAYMAFCVQQSHRNELNGSVSSMLSPRFRLYICLPVRGSVRFDSLFNTGSLARRRAVGAGGVQRSVWLARKSAGALRWTVGSRDAVMKLLHFLCFRRASFSPSPAKLSAMADW